MYIFLLNRVTKIQILPTLGSVGELDLESSDSLWLKNSNQVAFFLTVLSSTLVVVLRLLFKVLDHGLSLVSLPLSVFGHDLFVVLLAGQNGFFDGELYVLKFGFWVSGLIQLFDIIINIKLELFG